MQGWGTIYRKLVGRSEQGNDSSAYMLRGVMFSEVTAVFPRYIVAHWAGQ